MSDACLPKPIPERRISTRPAAARRRGALIGLIAGLCVPVVGAPSWGATQQIDLSARWNLIALNVDPVDPRVEAVLAPLGANFRSIWAYDAATGTWATYPHRAGDAALTTLAPGVGYWLRVHNAATLSITGADGIVQSAAPPLQPGWNLVGFVTDEPKGYDRALQGVPFDQLWTYVAGGFKGVVFGLQDGQRVIRREDQNLEVLNVQPGRGYWVWVAGTRTIPLRPELGTSLPSDVDVEPFLCGVTPCEERGSFSQISPGDRDIGGDGFFDLSDTQRAVDFGDFTSSHTLGIFNRGTGLLSWRVAIDDPDAVPWLSFRVTGELPGDDQFLTELAGSVATDSAAIELFVERRGLGPGIYDATIIVESNGDPEAEPARTIAISMQVPPLDGDYRVETRIEKVNGEDAELYNPRLFLSVYRDSETLLRCADDEPPYRKCIDGMGTAVSCNDRPCKDKDDCGKGKCEPFVLHGLKGILDGSRTLLIPERCVGDDPNGLACKDDAGADVSCNGRACSGAGDCGQGRCEQYVRLAGRVYQDGTNRFMLTGSFELPEGAEDNPYQADLRRDITLIGDRPKAGDTNLGPQDLTGTYHETIRNVLGDPIRLRGTFRASRVNALPTSRDEGLLINRVGPFGAIPDNTSCQPSEIHVADNLLLSEVDVEVDIDHQRPVQLKVQLETPSGRVITLRDRSSAPVGRVTYDETQEPLEPLDELVGDLSAGTWTLCVEDLTAGDTGTLNGWNLDLKGTRVSDIRGVVQGAGAGVRVLLSGCGSSRIATTNAKGEYELKNLIDCPYRLTVHHPSLDQAVEDVVLQGENREVILRPQPRTPPITGPDKFEDWRIEGTKCRVIRGAERCDDAPTREALCRFTSLTTSGGAGVYYEGCDKKQEPSCTPLVLSQAGRLQYALDSANFDIDRPPYWSCRSSVGNEDSNCFLNTPYPPAHPLAQSNRKNCGQTPPQIPNTTLDEPVSPRGMCPPSAPVRPCAVRAYVAIGMPIINASSSGNNNGPSVSGGVVMSIGANP